MSDEDKELTRTIATAEHTMATGPNGKGAVAAPKLSDDEHVEMEDILAAGAPAGPDEDIMQLARLGDVQGMERLLDSGKFDGTYADAEGITPLHVSLLGRIKRDYTNIGFSGRLSTTNMPCANFSSRLARMSTRREGNQ